MMLLPLVLILQALRGALLPDLLSDLLLTVPK
jgi:hypothetical protein